MEALKYKVITSDKQYFKYCKTLEELVFSSPKTKAIKDEIALLTLLIEKYDEEHNSFELAEPVPLLKSLMKDHKMKAVDLAILLDVSEGLVSDILNYKKGFSKETIRKLSVRFKLNQEAFNRPYELHVPVSPKFKNAKMMNTKKKTGNSFIKKFICSLRLTYAPYQFQINQCKLFNHLVYIHNSNVYYNWMPNS